MRPITLIATFAVFCVASYACSGDSDGPTSSQSGGGNGVGGGAVGGGGVGASVGCIDGLASIALSPANQTVQLDGVSAPTITFTASGLLDDGNTVDIPAANLAWEATRGDDTPPGDVVAGAFTPYAQAGGIVTITATDSCVSGSATVNLFLDVTLGSPNDPNDWTGAPTTMGGPLVVYPSSETRIPRNLYRTLFQWTAEGMSEFRITFDGPNANVVVYTDGAHGLCTDANPAAGCWEVNELAWNFIAGSNAGSTADWTVEGLDKSQMPPVIRASAPAVLGFSKQDVEGAIFYWSTTSAGIRRGRISQQEPEDYIVGKPVGTTYGSDVVGCVACHTVGRDGKYMVAPVKSSETGSLWVMEVTANAPPNPLVTDIADTGGHGFGTISPDNSKVVVSFKQDFMWMVDRATGAFLMELPTNDPLFDGGTHPDWSPDDTQLVFATGQGDGPGGASLALVPWDGQGWGAPSILLAPPTGKTNVFPMFDPVGDWVAFAQGAKAGHGESTLQLWVVNKNGQDAVEMINANRVTSNQMTTGQYQNSQPTWAPPGDYDWIAFNTKREYGVVLGEGTQQIWVAAVDKSKAANGQDPSYPAFRVPFQGLNENNHRAFWTLDIGQGGGGGMGGSGPPPCTDILTLGEVCDPTQDCCETNSYCDSIDQGETYTCISAVPN
jgi:hypothetical protein